MSNKRYFRPQVFERKFRLVLRLFSLDMEAKKVAEFTGLNVGKNGSTAPLKTEKEDP